MVSQNIVVVMFNVMIVFALTYLSFVEGGLRSNQLTKFNEQPSVNGTTWALLIAGSNGYVNYRHQADVCHAYHVLRKGGLKDENIIVFMYDDIAHNSENPRPGVIINSPEGVNVYEGVPKDYTGENVTAENIYAAILGDKKGIKGGSGKLLNTKPNDHIFIYYSDHGGVGTLGMPNDETMFANDFVNVLKKKHDSKSFKSMVIYMEACEAGSIFEGLLPKNISIYVTTASKPDESSYACYCGGPDIPKGYVNVCLGDLYSSAWMDDSEKSNLLKETLEEQFIKIKKRTSKVTSQEGTSHVMQYGDLRISKEYVALYIGADKNATHTPSHTNAMNAFPLDVMEQREADLFYLQQKVKVAEEGSIERIAAQKKLDEEIFRRKHVDTSVASIGQAFFGNENSLPMQNTARTAGQPLVDDWDCFQSMVKTFEVHCGPLGNYGRKYLRVFADMCNVGHQRNEMAQAAARECTVLSTPNQPILPNA